MPDLFIPLVQLPDNVGYERERHLIPHLNEGLRQSHTRAERAAARHTRREPATILDQPERFAARQINDLDPELEDELDDQLPRAIHDYAATAIITFDILTRGRHNSRQ